MEARLVRESSISQPLTAIAVIDSLISDASSRDVSDIHITPQRDGIKVRMRIDGLLEDARILPRSIHAAILARIKILSSLRTDEHFAAQDGRFRFTDTNGEEIDVRVSLIPTYFGENAVLRLLASHKEHRTLRSLGCRNSHQQLLQKALKRPYGMILATGPTGSGKTSLLYTLLQMLDSKTRSIVTLENPIEYSMDGINQIPVSSDQGLTFANGLRSVLRQDPDIIMVGEIRDTETARLSINASLTGHLVLSTLHTNDAVSTLPRLIDIGIEPYLIASTVHIIVAQRLVRKICDHCKIECEPKEQYLDLLRKSVPERIRGTDIFFTGKGCSECRDTGYKGRIGLFEVLVLDAAIREAILARENSDVLRTLALSRGMLPLSGEGLEKARKGITSLEEIARLSHD